jgi:hypothetical protein
MLAMVVRRAFTCAIAHMPSAIRCSFEVQGHAIVVTGFETYCDTGARPQVIDQPDTRGNEEYDDQSRSQILLHAATIFLSLEMPHRISDRRVFLDRG